jgi:hypothetical protein
VDEGDKNQRRRITLSPMSARHIASRLMENSPVRTCINTTATASSGNGSIGSETVEPTVQAFDDFMATHHTSSSPSLSPSRNSSQNLSRKLKSDASVSFSSGCKSPAPFMFYK